MSQNLSMNVTGGATDTREAHTIPLPSKGRWYSKYGYDKETIDVFELTTREEKILSQNRARPFDKFYSLVQRLIAPSTWIKPSEANPHGFSYDDLLLSDQFFIFMMIRAISVSEDYSFEQKCSSCGGKFQKTIKIPHDLNVLTADDIENPGEDYDVEIPFNGGEVTVQCRCLRVGDERAVQKKAKKGLKRAGDHTESETELRMARMLVGVDGAKFDSIKDALVFYYSLAWRASSFIRNEQTLREPGVSTDIEFECPSCGEEFEASLPMTADFFRAERQASPRHY